MQDKKEAGLSLRDWATSDHPPRTYTDEQMRRKLIWQMQRMAMRLNSDSLTVESVRELVADEIIRLYGDDVERMRDDMQNIVGWYNYSKAYVPEYEPVFPIWLAQMVDARAGSPDGDHAG